MPEARCDYCKQAVDSNGLDNNSHYGTMYTWPRCCCRKTRTPRRWRCSTAS